MAATKPYMVVPGITHEVNGTEFTFKPLTTRAAFTLKTIGAPVVRALTTLMGGGLGQETGRQEKHKQTGADFETETTTIAIDPALAKMKVDLRNKAIDELIEACTQQKNLDMLLGLIVDSLRDSDGRPTLADLLDSPINVLVQHIEGLIRANEATFGPLVSRLFVLRGTDSQDGPATETTTPIVSGTSS